MTGCAPGGTGEVRLVERNNESNVIARATIVVVQYTVPSHILHLRQTNQLDGALRVTWDAPRRTGGSAIVGYAVQHRLDGAAWASESPPVRDTSGTGTSHTVTGLRNGTKYHIRVTPCNRESACLHWSERMGFSHASVSGRPQAPTTPPPPPPITTPGPVRALTLTPGDGQLAVSWEAPDSNGGTDITGYAVTYRGHQTQPNWTPWSHDGTGTTATITGRTNNTRYDVRVRACNHAADETARCSQDWRTGHGTPEAPRPRNLNVVPLAWSPSSGIDRAVELTWERAPGATRYQVQAQVLGAAAWEAGWCMGDSATSREQVTQPSCVIDLDHIAEISGSLAGLHTYKAFAPASSGAATADKPLQRTGGDHRHADIPRQGRQHARRGQLEAGRRP